VAHKLKPQKRTRFHPGGSGTGVSGHNTCLYWAGRASSYPVAMHVENGEGTRTPEKHEHPGQRPRYVSVDLTHQHTNRAVLVEGAEITIGRVDTRRVVKRRG
jgi:hypothetical protein